MAEHPDPIGSWDLDGDGRDGGAAARHAEAVGEVAWEPAGAAPGGAPGGTVARLAGSGRFIVREPAGADGDLTVAAWVRPAERARTVLGDVVARFDPAGRRGFTLGFEHGSPCGSHGNDRTPWFGADAHTDPRLTDHGRPGDERTVMVCSLASFRGALWAATWEQGPAPRGRVWRLDGTTWTDCGSPWDANAVTRLAVHDGALYAGVSRLRGGGSGLEDSANQSPGGRVLRLEDDGSWADMGQLEGADSIAGLVPFDGALYAIPMYSEGLYRLDAPGRWTWCGSPGRRLLALGLHAGALYGAGNDHADVVSAIAMTKAGVVVPARESAGGGGVFRYDGGTSWTSRGLQPDTTQLYSIETYGDAMYIGTWPTGYVFRATGLEGPGEPTWVNAGRLGDETEIMNLQAYNGKLYGGTLPHAELHRCDADGTWTPIATLDTTPDVRYRRAASIVLHDGGMFVGTLPSARVHELRAGAVASTDSLPPGWHHLAGVRRGDRVEVYVDGMLAGTGAGPLGSGSLFAGAPGAPLVIGGGPRAGFEGELARVRLWDRALDAAEVARVAAERI